MRRPNTIGSWTRCDLGGARTRPRQFRGRTSAKDEKVNAAATPTATEPAGPRLYMITVPGLQVRLDWAAVHDRLLDDFPRISSVLATTIPETLLIVYEGEDDIDAWLDGISDGILSRRMSAGNAPRAATPMHQLIQTTQKRREQHEQPTG
jgi:hypothetical protein